MDPPSAMPPISSYEESFEAGDYERHEEYGEQGPGDETSPPYPVSAEDRLDSLLMDSPTFKETPAPLSISDGANHSLPTAEEARLNALLDGSNPHSGRQKRMFLLVGICFAALVAIVGFSVAIAKSDSSPRGSSVAAAPVFPLEQGPSISEIHDFLVSRGVSELVDLENSQTPQHRASQWMADYDLLQLEIPTDEANAIAFEERYILAVFYYAMNGDNWTETFNFLLNSPVCDWNIGLRSTQTLSESETQVKIETKSWKLGVECNTEGRVNSLFMTSNNLHGEFPPEMGHLADLEHLSFYQNKILGELPTQMTSLSKLRFLALRDNQLSGSLPSWLNELAALEYLNLGSNSFEGTLPSFEGMTNLKELALDLNSLTGGIDALDDIDGVEAVFLNDNALDGRVHGASFRNFDNLVHVDLSNNQLTGTFHEHMFMVKVVKMNNNLLSEYLPDAQLKDFPIEYLSLHDNQLTGDIPSSIGFLGQLTSLDLGNNELDGTIPDSVNNLVNLRQLLLSNNPFTEGHIPMLKDLVELREVSLDSTNRIMKIPSWFGDLTNLNMLDLQNNALSGEVPAELGNLPNLGLLALNRNDLEGYIPSEWANMKGLAVLFLDNNSFSGSVGDICVAGVGPESLQEVIADCDEVACDCCNSCCSDGDDSCNTNNVKVKKEENHLRTQRVFSEDVIFELSV